jgi:pimeloyl-ACP methyl ester carboxylesterase|tara:strand:- start:1260 stop:2039 length:780 start_codon:yes stop_codon:yes gene_type:complete
MIAANIFKIPELQPQLTCHMASFQTNDAEIHYDEYGTGFPILLIAPGGMKSEASFWNSTPWNPISQLSEKFRVIAMDQRNAGRSTGAITADDGWQTYTNDQLALCDHLGIDRFIVAGMCIGGPYAMGLIESAPERVAAGVLFQTIGLSENRHAFYDMFDSWADELRPMRSEVTEDAWHQFKMNMYGGDNFLFNVDENFVRSVQTPLLLLEGNDLYHPSVSSLAVNDLAQNTTLIRQWQRGTAMEEAAKQFENFCQKYSV